MTKDKENLYELEVALCSLVGIAEDAVGKEEFEKLDNAGAEIIDCLAELKEYRAIGTVEECKTDKIIADKAYKFIRDDYESFLEYEKIGTIEEFKALKEKSEQKKPNNIPMDDACIYYENHCPNCDSLLVVRYKCCPKCGQKIDWSE